MRNAICEHVASGKSLISFVKGPDRPSYSAINEWLNSDLEFQKLYACAKQDSADVLAEEIQAIADDGSNDTYVDADGKERVDYDNVQRSRLRVDARKWLAAHLKPHKWGEKVAVEHSGQIDSKVTMTEERRLQLVEKRRKARSGEVHGLQ